MRIYIKKLHLELCNPVTGAFITADDAAYVYTGFQIPKKSQDLLHLHQVLLQVFMTKEMEKI